MALISEIISWLIIILLPVNWTWDIWTDRMRRAVPGSLMQAHAREKCRLVRWPAAMCWPGFGLTSIPFWATHPPSDHAAWAVGLVWAFRAICSLLWVKWGVRDIRELRRQIAEDEDDWWNKAKRGAKKLWSSAKSKAKSLVPSPVMPLPGGAGA